MSMTAVTLRRAGAADQPALCSLWCTAWQETYPAFDYLARWPGMWAHWQGSQAEIFVASREDAGASPIIGMLVLIQKVSDVLELEQIALPSSERGSVAAAPAATAPRVNCCKAARREIGVIVGPRCAAGESRQIF